jgi:hypothetical protein
MSEIPGLPSPTEESKMAAAYGELRLEQERQLAEENKSKIWKLPLEGALYWARKNQVPAAAWLHSVTVRNRRLWIAFELVLWSASLPSLIRLILRLFH